MQNGDNLTVCVILAEKIQHTAAEITPIRELDNRVIGEGKAGPVTKAVQAAFFRAARGDAPAYADWLTPYTF